MPDHPPGTVWAGHGSPSGLTSGPATRQPVPSTLTTTPCHSAYHRAVQETGRGSGTDGSIITGTPALPRVPANPRVHDGELRGIHSVWADSGTWVRPGRRGRAAAGTGSRRGPSCPRRQPAGMCGCSPNGQKIGKGRMDHTIPTAPGARSYGRRRRALGSAACAPTRPSPSTSWRSSPRWRCRRQPPERGLRTEDALTCTVVSTEGALWAALLTAGPDGAPITDLMAACGMGRSWVYYRLREHARAGRAIQTTRGAWRAVRPGDGRPPGHPGTSQPPRGPRRPRCDVQ